MADIRPFLALHYPFEAATQFSKKIAPPYDVISRSKREELLKRDAHNCIRIILGDPSTLNESELSDQTRYTEAAKTLQQWRKEGILVQDQTPSLYLLEDQFEWQGKNLSRVGILLTVKIEEFGNGMILPHEKTLSSPIEDRLQLMRNTKTQESPIYLTFDDQDQAVQPLLNPILQEKPVAEFKNLDETIRHRLYRIDQPKTIDRLQRALQPKPFLIADGHHRYTTALHYSKDEGKNNEHAQYVLALAAPAPHHGVVLSAIHRIFDSHENPTSLQASLKKSFKFETGPIDWRQFQSSKAIVSLVDVEHNIMMLLTPTEDALSSIEPSLRGVPSVILNELIVKKELGLDLALPEHQKKVTYIKHHDDLLPTLRQKRGLGVWLKPLTVTQVIEIAAEGHVLPQKSTFFYPKVMSGLVFHPLT